MLPWKLLSHLFPAHRLTRSAGFTPPSSSCITSSPTRRSRLAPRLRYQPSQPAQMACLRRRPSPP
jgi:hypothetical protein